MHEHGVVYANNLPLNHDITMHPATQEHQFISGGAKRLPLILTCRCRSFCSCRRLRRHRRRYGLAI
jgi:hypothetical protein